MTRHARLAVVASIALILPGCIKYHYDILLNPDGSGRVEIHLRVRKDVDPNRQAADKIEKLLAQMKLGGKNTRMITTWINQILMKATVESLDEYSEGIVAWKRPKIKKSGSSTTYDLVGYFEDINKVKLRAEEDLFGTFKMKELDEGGYVLEFKDTTPESGFRMLEEDHDVDLSEWSEAKKVLQGVQLMHTIRMPGKITDAGEMRSSLREAFVRMKLPEVKVMLETPGAREEGISGRIVSEPAGNVTGEMKSFAKEFGRVKKQWKRLNEEVGAYDLPDLGDD